VTDTFDNRLAALRQRFRDRANATSEVLEGIAADLERGAPGTLLQAEIQRIAHSLAGGGGTFGFAAISACAARLEEFANDLPDSPELPGACRALISEIERADYRGSSANGRR
jgi:HPt (histidine-containing phosphotransfer) domain-containing protein